MSKRRTAFDEIGPWSEVKLEIVRKYATAYSTILAKQPGFAHYYVDGFAGAGFHLSKTTGQWVRGSPLNALWVQPPFKHFFFIDLDGGRVESLRAQLGRRRDVTLLEGDCNELLLKNVLPRVRFSSRRRALCLLDPYGLQLDWRVIQAAGKLRTIDLFLNFPIMGINRAALWTNPKRVPPHLAAKLTRFWGDESWRDAAYHPSLQGSLFQGDDVQKVSNGAVVAAFRNRLRDVAGFANVPEPMPMRDQNREIYYLFFASQNSTANKIVNDIFRRHALPHG